MYYKKKVFISHSSKDIYFVSALLELLEKIGLNENNIFCSSIPEYGIPLGENIYNYLAKEFLNNSLFVIYILSDNYYLSVACLNEMGASWVLKNDYLSVLLPHFKYKSIEGAIDPQKIGINFDDNTAQLKHRLGELKNLLLNMFNKNDITFSKWERYRDEFINKIQCQNNYSSS